MSTRDGNYIKAIRNGEEARLREMYTAFLPRITALIRRNGGTEEDARDVFQEALIVIYRKSQAPDFQLTSQFYTLLYGICRNLWGNQLQKKSRTEVKIADTHAYENIPDATALPERTEERRLFWDAFGRLGPDCQQLLRLFFSKVKMEEITRRLNINSVGYAKKKKYKCKEQLIQLVKKDRRYAELKFS